MSIATIVDALVEAGATPQMIAAAVRAHAQKEEDAKTEKRAKDAERQRRHRLSRDVTVTPRDKRDIPSPLCPPSSSPTPPTTTPLNPPNPNSARKRPHEYSEGFSECWVAYPKREGDNPKKPASKAYEGAIKRGVSHAQILAAVRSYAGKMAGKDAKFVAQFVTWLNQDRWEGHAPEPVVVAVTGPAPRMKTVAEIEAQIEQRRMELGADAEDDGERRDVSAGGVAAHEVEAAEPGWNDRGPAPRGYARSTVVGLVSQPDRVSERAAAGAGKSWKTLHGSRADSHGLRPRLEGPEAVEPAAYTARHSTYRG